MKLATLAAVFLAASLLPAQAGETVKYPAAEPAFSFDLPDKWTAKVDDDGQLIVAANDDSGFFVTIRPAKEGEIGSETEAKTYPAKLAKGMGDAAGLTDAKVAEVFKSPNSHGVTFYLTNLTGKIDAQELTITAVAFTPTDGDYYVITSAVPTAVDEAHADSMTKVVESMKPVE